MGFMEEVVLGRLGLEKTAVSPETAGRALGERSARILKAISKKVSVPMGEETLGLAARKAGPWGGGVYENFARRMGVYGSPGAEEAMQRSAIQQLFKSRLGFAPKEQEMEYLMKNLPTGLSNMFEAGATPHFRQSWKQGLELRTRPMIEDFKKRTQAATQEGRLEEMRKAFEG